MRDKNNPVLGCPTCNTTAGKLGCPIHCNTGTKKVVIKSSK